MDSQGRSANKGGGALVGETLSPTVQQPAKPMEEILVLICYLSKNTIKGELMVNFW
jgi:hypothetical protein